MGERSRHANEVNVVGGFKGVVGGHLTKRKKRKRDAHTTWLVLLIKDGRGPARNYPLISTPLPHALLCVCVHFPLLSSTLFH